MQRAATIPASKLQPPWFSIVGAPRCGTTSLSHYLSAHPAVWFSRLKEPHFFSQHDLRDVAEREFERVVRTQYMERYFEGATEDQILGEASVSYLYAPERLTPVREIWPEAKFIIAVRNPLQMLPSLHLRHLHNGDESERDFARAWKLTEERRRGKRVPRSCIDPRLLDYQEIGQLGKHVRRFLDFFGSEQCTVSVFDDLAADPAREYRRILGFLGLRDDGRQFFSVHRPSKRIRSTHVQRLLRRPPAFVRDRLIADAESYRRGNDRRDGSRMVEAMKAARATVLRWNQVEAAPRKLSPELVEELSDYFRTDIALLSDVLGRDLSHWLRPPVF